MLTKPLNSATLCGYEVLQRGRARAGAECQPVHFVTLSMSWLQRGRARAGAECRIVLELVAILLLASTGPRPRGRGVGLITCWRGRILWSFNGAAPARARSDLS